MSLQTDSAKLCERGCGEQVKLPYHRYINGHNRKKHPSDYYKQEPPLCLCGCEQRVATIGAKYITGHQRKGKHHTEESKEKLRQAHLGIPNLKLRGRPKSELHRKALSLAKKGKPNPKVAESLKRSEKAKIARLKASEACRLRVGKLNHFYGKHHTKKTIKLLSELAFIRFENPENHPTWKGGLSKLPYNFNFDEELKEKIRERDNYTCQLCGIPESKYLTATKRKLTIHHIDYDKQNCDEYNLISLCVGCNSKVNFSRDSWEIYFKNKIKEKYENTNVTV